jgi:tripartite-type tricarboxylate transporter receptor subunit TctC
MRHSLQAAAITLALGGGIGQSCADYPERAINIIVPYTPGGTVDVLARALGQRMTAAWGQPVVILNRPGAGGSVGADAAAKAAPDGYTLFISTNSPLTTNLALYPNLGYDPLRDFEPVIVAGDNSLVLATYPQVPAKSIDELIKLAKSKPGELNASTSGNGSTAHLSLATFNKMAGVSITHVPYRGGMPSLMGAVAGEVHMVFSDIVPAAPLVKDKKLNGLAMTGLRRAGVAPEIPTLDELGLKGFSITAWIGMVAPKGTPKDIVQKVNLEVNKALKDPEFTKQISALGIDPLGNTPEEFDAFLRKEIPRWKQIVKEAGAKVE